MSQRARKKTATSKPPSEASSTLRLPADLSAELAVIARAEGRSRTKQIEIALRDHVQNHRHRTAA
jgi:predicted transcriptional regulator